MDKTDIFRVESLYYPPKFDKKEINDKILESFYNKHITDKRNVKTDSDDTFIYLSFIYDFNFKESINILNKLGNLNMFIDSAVVSNDSIELWNDLKSICYKKINNF